MRPTINGERKDVEPRMARADLHQAYAIDREIYEASMLDRSLFDPVVYIEGSLPAVARPFMVLREYQGPQGLYVEEFMLTDANGREVARAPRTRINLTGEAFEDRFVSALRNVHITDLDEHTLTFFIGDDEVGSVPVFIEPVGGGDARTAAEATFAAALKKSTILWVTVPAGSNGRGAGRDVTRPVWFVMDNEKIYVLSGPTEQHVPGLDKVQRARISARGKDTRSLIANVDCDVEIVPSDDERWSKFTQTALIRRLNLVDADHALERWKQHCVLAELTPRFGPSAAERRAARPAAAATTVSTPEAAPAQAPRAQEDEIHVEAQVDQEVFDRLVSEGLPERVARARAKAHYVRNERARIRAEREQASA